MSQAYVIEVRSKAAGIVVRDGQKFQFFAATRQFARLEGHVFRSPRDAEKAARHAAERRRITSTVGGDDLAEG